MRLYVTRKMPDPRDAGYEEALAAQVEKFVEMSRGRPWSTLCEDSSAVMHTYKPLP